METDEIYILQMYDNNFSSLGAACASSEKIKRPRIKGYLPDVLETFPSMV